MKFIAGHPALDFVNTVGGWMLGNVVDDKLESFADLVRWARLAQVMDARDAAVSARLGGERPREGARILARARTLRGVLYRLIHCVVENRSPSQGDVRALQRELRAAREHRTLAARGGGFDWVWEKRPALECVLWRISQSAAELLTSPHLARVRRCAGENCGWMFLDNTRNHSRHWCDMKDCGNLAKVRRFRERRARR